MGRQDSRVDDYIAKAAPFAQPILRHVRKLAHKGCPQVMETIKWNFPHFDHHGIILGIAAFKQHCAIGFWKGQLVVGKSAGGDGAMGHFGKITSLRDLPSDTQFVAYVRKAAELNETGVGKPREKPATKTRKPLTIPGYFTTALAGDKKAAANFERFSPSHKKEYLDWINEAKREETREQRLRTAIKWIAQGKPRNWKYMQR
jgi:uncharacterized protein YdeI (YjbR/CyaY-like superfamily)